MIIRTNISAENKKAHEILNSVIGQMSDGIWENSNMDRYWKFVDIEVDGELVIKVSDEYNDMTLGWDWRRGRNVPKWQKNAFRHMTADKVLEFFANKIRQIAFIELDDNGYAHSEWKADSDISTNYLNYNEDITMGEAYKVRKQLLKVAKELKEVA